MPSVHQICSPPPHTNSFQHCVRANAAKITRLASLGAKRRKQLSVFSIETKENRAPVHAGVLCDCVQNDDPATVHTRANDELVMWDGCSAQRAFAAPDSFLALLQPVPSIYHVLICLSRLA